MIPDNYDEDANANQTPKKIIGGPGMMNGAETGTPFTKNYQPPPQNKSAGKAKKRTLRALLRITSPGKMGTSQIDYAEKACEFFGWPKSRKREVTLKMIMEFRQIEKAIVGGDTNAYEAVMKRAFGNPNQPLSGKNGEPLMPPQMEIVHVHSNKPLAESEDEIED